MERGIILGPEVDREPEKGGLLVRSEPNPSLLRQAVLYWDLIEFPTSYRFHVNSGDIEFLRQAGVARTRRLRVESNGWDWASLFVETQLAALDALNRETPGMWTLAQLDLNLICPSRKVVQRDVVEIRLNSLLPVPPNDVPLADLLTLKERRKDEFRALRVRVDELFQGFLDSGESPRAGDAAVYRLQRAIADIRKVVERSWLDQLSSSLKFEFTIPLLVAAALGGRATAADLGVWEIVGAAVGAVATGIKFSLKPGNVLSDLPPETRNFAYIYHVGHEFPGTFHPSRDTRQRLG